MDITASSSPWTHIYTMYTFYIQKHLVILFDIMLLKKHQVPTYM